MRGNIKPVEPGYRRWSCKSKGEICFSAGGHIVEKSTTSYCKFERAL